MALRNIFTAREGVSHNMRDRKHMLEDSVRNLLIVAFGEFCGTFMFLMLGFAGAQTAINNNEPVVHGGRLAPASLFYIACAFGTAIAVNVWVFYRVTGGMFNPAVTLGLTLVGAVKPLRAILIIPSQIVAAIAAAAVVDGLLPGPLTVVTTLGDGTSQVQGVFLEMFLTAQLVLTVYFLAVEKHKATYLAPIGIGIAVFIAHIVGVNYTGASINPARSFGPACIVGFVGYHWIYWVGPLMGSLLAFLVYSILKWLAYQSANPGQDDDDMERAAPITSSTAAVHQKTDHRSTHSDASDPLRSPGLGSREYRQEPVPSAVGS
ncbi:aquaporin [Metarhizium album ARSEF 1941]|uniref:Aquaporin n=1 Tax=Metarhizium album (strain ARSEF 1941) TaxID=1081103 RepID=A0A0B2X4X5_METAS|nr:aquaporin [Metarhizium album ARSEF 1941]KHO01424.1 aquaporin [Metarhizium album ARSEF 1941]